MFWGNFFENFFYPVFHVESSLRNVFKKSKTFKIQKSPKSFPNCPKVFWTCFGVIFSKKIFCRVFHGGSSIRNVFKKSKIFQNSIIAQNRSQNWANVFWTCFGVIFLKILFAQCSMEGRVFEMFSKNQKTFKIPKTPKIVPKLSKSVLNMFWGTFSGNFSLRSVAWRVESSKCF